MFEVDNEDEAVRRAFDYLFEGGVPVPRDYGVWLIDESNLEKGLENRLVWCVFVHFPLPWTSVHADVCYVDSETGLVWTYWEASPFPPRQKRRHALRQTT